MEEWCKSTWGGAAGAATFRWVLGNRFSQSGNTRRTKQHTVPACKPDQRTFSLRGVHSGLSSCLALHLHVTSLLPGRLFISPRPACIPFLTAPTPILPAVRRSEAPARTSIPILPLQTRTTQFGLAVAKKRGRVTCFRPCSAGSGSLRPEPDAVRCRRRGHASCASPLAGAMLSRRRVMRRGSAAITWMPTLSCWQRSPTLGILPSVLKTKPPMVS